MQQVACYINATVHCMMSVHILLSDITCVCVCVQTQFGVAVPSNGEGVNVPFTSAVRQTNGHTGTPHIDGIKMDRDSSVGVATRYGLDGPEIRSRWRGEIFRTCPVPPTQPPIQCVPGLSRR